VTRTGGLLRIAVASLRADLRGAVVNGAAACLGGAALVFFLALGLGVSRATGAMFPADARLVEVVPGRLFRNPVMSRFNPTDMSGRSESISCPSEAELFTAAVSNIGACASTLIDSESSPGLRVTSTLASLRARTSTGSRVEVEKPSFDTMTRYKEAGRLGAKYNPSPFVLRSSVLFVWI
jgi:hypothetical protein